MKIAIIGSGISGLSAALLLSQKHHITLFEIDKRFGGHANTVKIKNNNTTVSVDTGFIVFNKLNYPNLIGFFKHLNVETIKSDMSFAVSARDGELEYSGSLAGMFAQKKNYFNLKFYKMLRDIIKFFLFGYKYAFDVKEDETLKDYLKRCKFSDEFANDHLIPMSSAIWSCPEKEILTFPARNLLAFFKNHQLINFFIRPQWRTVKGGSIEYIKKAIKKLEQDTNNKLLLDTKITSITSKNKKIKVEYNQNYETFDKIIMATHPDQTLKLIKDLDKESIEILSKFQYQKNTIILHSDPSNMPSNSKTWSSWNYLSDKNGNSSTTYWMNQLQDLNTSLNLFVTLNPFKLPKKSLIHQKITYEHPIFNNKTNEAQIQINKIQGKNNIYYAGAWLGNGFHEDGISSAIKVIKYFNIKVPWKIK